MMPALGCAFIVEPPPAFSMRRAVAARLLCRAPACAPGGELCCEAVGMQPLAEELGFPYAPLRWDGPRRELMSAVLDGAYFHLYGLAGDEVDYVMDTFPIITRKDERAHGEYSAKSLTGERYNALADAIATGVPYEAILDPPLADSAVAHRAFL
jgi:hypothetical protein